VTARVLVAIGASAGGVEALQAVVAGLPVDLDAAVLVVLHVPRSGPSALPRILNRAGPLPAAHARDGEELTTGRIYIAPPDHHLLVLEGRIRLTHGPVENGHRPAIDVLFRSAARAAGPRTVAVTLSGARDDGAAGAAVVARCGGQVLVQEPDEALYPSMPRSVIESTGDGQRHPAKELGGAIGRAVRQLNELDDEVFQLPADDRLTALEVAMADLTDHTVTELSDQPAGLACPSCHGSLFELAGEPSPRYRCWVGHAWSARSLLDEQATAFESALWMALRSLEEKASLTRRMGVAATRRRSPGTAERYEAITKESEQAAHLIREIITKLTDLNRRSVDG